MTFLISKTDEVGKCVSCWCQVFWGCNTPKIVKIG